MNSYLKETIVKVEAATQRAAEIEAERIVRDAGNKFVVASIVIRVIAPERYTVAVTTERK